MVTTVTSRRFLAACCWSFPGPYRRCTCVASRRPVILPRKSSSISLGEALHLSGRSAWLFSDDVVLDLGRAGNGSDRTALEVLAAVDSLCGLVAGVQQHRRGESKTRCGAMIRLTRASWGEMARRLIAETASAGRQVSQSGFGQNTSGAERSPESQIPTSCVKPQLPTRQERYSMNCARVAL